MQEIFTADRVRLRRPEKADAQAIFDCYGSNSEVTRYLSWPQHESLKDTLAFIKFSDATWEAWHAGPWLIEERESDVIIGSTGVVFKTATRVSTGYVLAPDYWGSGLAVEALQAVLKLLSDSKVWRVEAVCHIDHSASVRVLEKAGFEREGTLRRHTIFPNLAPEPQDVFLFSKIMW